MRTITARQFIGYMQNAWLAGLSQTELLRELICIHDIEVSEKMEQALIVFYSNRDRQFNLFVPTLHSEIQGH